MHHDCFINKVYKSLHCHISLALMFTIALFGGLNNSKFRAASVNVLLYHKQLAAYIFVYDHKECCLWNSSFSGMLVFLVFCVASANELKLFVNNFIKIMNCNIILCNIQLK